jgi:hypothetical protein
MATSSPHFNKAAFQNSSYILVKEDDWGEAWDGRIVTKYELKDSSEESLGRMLSGDY